MLIELPGGGTRLGGTSGPTRRFRLGEHVFFGSLFTSCQKVTLSKSFFFFGGKHFVENLPSFWGSKPTLLPKFVAGIESG